MAHRGSSDDPLRDERAHPLAGTRHDPDIGARAGRQPWTWHGGVWAVLGFVLLLGALVMVGGMSWVQWDLRPQDLDHLHWAAAADRLRVELVVALDACVLAALGFLLAAVRPRSPGTRCWAAAGVLLAGVTAAVCLHFGLEAVARANAWATGAM